MNSKRDNKFKNIKSRISCGSFALVIFCITCVIFENLLQVLSNFEFFFPYDDAPSHLLKYFFMTSRCCVPFQCEPTLLPEPNHVMLNHLYALSIRDGVMVLSATHRYRKKYVTTLLYKPI